MLTEKELVDNHVLYEQNYVINELLKQEAISYDSIHNFDEEVLEWWLVTAWLAEYLKAEGETIIEDLDCCWWGRTQSGQAIYMDAVITEICQSFD